MSGLALLALVTVGSHLINDHLYRASVQSRVVLGELRRLKTGGEGLVSRGRLQKRSVLSEQMRPRWLRLQRVRGLKANRRA